MSTYFGRVTIPAYGDWSISRSSDGHMDGIRGMLYADTAAEAKLLRTNLEGHQGDYIAITDDTDTDINGFYFVESVRIDSLADYVPFQGDPVFTFEASLQFIGDYASAKGQSIYARVPGTEDFSTTPSYWWAPPIGAQAVEIGDADSTDVDRDGADGTISVSTDIDDDCNPTWSVAPDSLYDGACYIYAGDQLRVGRKVPMDPTDWYIGNGLMEVRPSAYQSTSDGELQFRFHDGTAWGDWTNFQINWAGTNKVPSWNFFNVIWSQPELVIVRLQRDAAEAPFSQRKLHELDITLRRGGRHVSCVYKFTGTAATHALESTETDTATRPGGTASYAYLDTLISGDRIVYGTPRDFTLSGLEIQLDSADQSFPFWIGAAVDNASTGTGNGPADLAEQFVGQSPERVRIVNR